MIDILLVKHICDYCGNEQTLEKKSTSFVVHLSTLNAYAQAVEQKRHILRPIEVSFCQRDCFCEWIKEHLTPDGHSKTEF